MKRGEGKDVEAGEAAEQLIRGRVPERLVVHVDEVAVAPLLGPPLALEVRHPGHSVPRSAPVPETRTAPRLIGHGGEDECRMRMMRPEAGPRPRGEVLAYPVEPDHQERGNHLVRHAGQPDV